MRARRCPGSSRPSSSVRSCRSRRSSANAAHRNLGANPIAEALNQLGLAALVLLLASLACTPLREILDWTWAIALRRMLGLLALFYALLHVATYSVLDQGFAVGAIVADVTKRPFILAGFAAFVLLIPLAATSTAASVQRLGSGAGSVFTVWPTSPACSPSIHFFLRVKKDVSEPAVYGIVLAALLLARLVLYLRKRVARTTSAA